MTTTVRSADGTPVAVETAGSGPPLVLAVGVFCDRTTTRPLAELLAEEFTVHAYDRRGRGDTPDTAPYTAVRELEDLAAVVAHAGGTPALYGHSNGAILALRVVAAGLPVSHLVAYEPPWRVEADDTSAQAAADLRERVDALAAEGRDADLVAEFVATAFGLPPAAMADLRASPAWARMTSFAASVPHDAAVTGDQRVPVGALARIDVPTLVLAGGESERWARETASAVAAVVPGARLATVPGQGHAVEAGAIAAVLTGFLSAD